MANLYSGMGHDEHVANVSVHSGKHIRSIIIIVYVKTGKVDSALEIGAIGTGWL